MADKSASVDELLCCVSASTHVCVVSTLPWKRKCLCLLCVLPSCFRSVQSRDSQLRSAQKMEHPLFVMHGTAATICVQILRAMLYYVCIQTLYCFFGGLSHNRRFWSTASERQSVTSWVATRCLALKTFCKYFFLFIVGDFWWTRRGANKHSQTDKVKTRWTNAGTRVFSQCGRATNEI